ncbi:MAG TPA: hypothetical protein VH599_10340 [Ktedonobacterales bacterium]|jgi:MFS family permease
MKHRKHWLLYLYPQAWRARYGEEFLALLEACPFSLWTLWDVCLGAVDAHLHLESVTGRMFPLMNRLRTTAVIVFCAYIGFVVAGLAFGKMVEYDDFTDLLDSTTSVAVSYWALYAGAFAALLAVLVGGLPLAVAVARSAIAAKRWRLLALFAVPPLSLAVWIGSGALLLWLTPGDFLSRPILQRILVGGLFFGLFGLAAIASAAAVCIVVIRSQISEKLFRFARIPAIITTLAMIVMFAATLVYGIAARAADPQLFAEDEGLLASNTTLTWLVILALMAVATAVAIAALIRGRAPDAPAAAMPTIAGQPAT